MKLTSHFTVEELTTTNRKDYAEANKKRALQDFSLLMRLSFFAEQVRYILGVPMTITSGYREYDLNILVGGSANSQHLLFEAIDFIPKGMSIDKAFKILKDSKMLFGQLIKEKSGNSEWIHISIGEKRQCLAYKNGKYESA